MTVASMVTVSTRLSMALIAALAAGGCSWTGGEEGMFRDRGLDYQHTELGEPLTLPAGLDGSQLKELLAIPDIGSAATRATGAFDVPRAEFFYADAGNDVVNIARDGSEKLLVVEEGSNKVWGKLHDYLSYNNVGVALSDPANQTLETEWVPDEATRPGFFARLGSKLSFRAVEGPSMDRYRLTATPRGAMRTAIRLQHVRYPQSKRPGTVDWENEAQDVSYTSAMIYDMLQFLSKSTARTTALELRRQEQGSKTRTLFGRDAKGRPVLKVTTDIDRVWDMVSEALTQAEIDVGSSDRELGVFFMTYAINVPQVSEKRSGVGGFIDWLNSDRGDITLGSVLDEDKDRIQYSAKQRPVTEDSAEPKDLSQQEGFKIWLGDRVIYVFEGKEADAKPVKNTETGLLENLGRYQLRLSRRLSGVFVSVADDKGLAVAPHIAEEILWTLKEHLPSS